MLIIIFDRFFGQSHPFLGVARLESEPHAVDLVSKPEKAMKLARGLLARLLLLMIPFKKWPIPRKTVPAHVLVHVACVADIDIWQEPAPARPAIRQLKMLVDVSDCAEARRGLD